MASCELVNRIVMDKRRRRRAKEEPKSGRRRRQEIGGLFPRLRQWVIGNGYAKAAESRGAVRQQA